MEPAKISKIGKYEVLDVIGRGGMGMVYKAVDPTIGRLVAIKMVTTGVSDDPGLLKRFYREAQSTGKLQHPNIVTLHDLGDRDGIPYLVMEYLEGESLEKVIKDRRSFSVPEKLHIIIQVCAGLAYAHEREIVHRDMKPGNIVVLNDGAVKIVDFGIARFGNERFTRTGQVVGSLYYMSPEQINDADLDARSDIYSTGVVLFEFLTYALPFRGKDATSTLAKILHEPPPSLSNYLKLYPGDLDHVLHRAMAKDRNERYVSMEDFELDLQRVQENLSRDLIADYVRNAERCIMTRDWNKAKEHLRQVAKLDRQHRRANELLREVQTQIQKEQLGEQVRQLRAHAEEAVGLRLWDEALAYLDQAIKLDTENFELIELRDSIIRSSALLADALRRAESAHQAGDLEAAKRAVEEALGVDPSHTTAKALNAILAKEIAERSKRKQVDSLIAEARKELVLRHFTGALDLLHKAETIGGLVSEVQQLINTATAGREQERRRKALDQACSEIEALLNRDEYASACAKVDVALQAFPQDAGLLKLKSFAEKQREAWARRLFIESQITSARQLVDAGDLVRAEALLSRALEQHPGDSSLLSLLSIVTDGIAREEEQRRVAERKSQERRYVDLQLASATELLRTGQNATALTRLENALCKYPNNQELKSQVSVIRGLLAREKIELERAKHEMERRRTEIDSEIRGARTLLNANQPGDAVAALEQAWTRYPESEELRLELDLAKQRLSREQVEQEARRRLTGVANEIKAARQLLEANQTSQAVTTLEQAWRRYPDSEELKSQLSAARQRLWQELSEQERAEKEMRRKEADIASEIEAASRLLEAQHTSIAVMALKKALNRYPESNELKSCLEVASRRVAQERKAEQERAEQEALSKRTEVEKEIRIARQLLEANQTSKAVEILQRAVLNYPESEALPSQLAAAEQALKREQTEEENVARISRARRVGVEAELKIATQLVQSNQTAKAQSSLTDAVRRYPESEELRAQLAAVTQELAAEARQREQAAPANAESAVQAQDIADESDIHQSSPSWDSEIEQSIDRREGNGHPPQGEATRMMQSLDFLPPLMERSAEVSEKVPEQAQPPSKSKKILLLVPVGIVVLGFVSYFGLKLSPPHEEENPQSGTIVQPEISAPPVSPELGPNPSAVPNAQTRNSSSGQTRNAGSSRPDLVPGKDGSRKNQIALPREGNTIPPPSKAPPSTQPPNPTQPPARGQGPFQQEVGSGSRPRGESTPPTATNSGQQTKPAQQQAVTPTESVSTTQPAPAVQVPAPPEIPNKPDRSAVNIGSAERTAVLAALERYRQAYESESVDEIAKVWPSLSKQQRKTLKETFSGVQAFRMTLHVGEPQIAGNEALVSCEQSVVRTERGKVQNPQTNSVEIRLTKLGDGTWVVGSVAGH
jgi:serine/threonine-protein kinase